MRTTDIYVPSGRLNNITFFHMVFGGKKKNTQQKEKHASMRSATISAIVASNANSSKDKSSNIEGLFSLISQNMRAMHVIGKSSVHTTNNIWDPVGGTQMFLKPTDAYFSIEEEDDDSYAENMENNLLSSQTAESVLFDTPRVLISRSSNRENDKKDVRKLNLSGFI